MADSSHLENRKIAISRDAAERVIPVYGGPPFWIFEIKIFNRNAL